MAHIRNGFSLAVLLLMILSLVMGCASKEKKEKEPEPVKRGFRVVVKCVKVNSLEEIVVEREKERFTVSLMGLELPPKTAGVYFPAMEYLKSLEGRELVVDTFAPVEKGHVDALVYLKADHKPVARFGSQNEYTINLNAKMIEMGFARLDSEKVPENYRKTLESSEAEAKSAGFGMWQ